jgi:hypothetical protein
MGTAEQPSAGYDSETTALSLESGTWERTRPEADRKIPLVGSRGAAPGRVQGAEPLANQVATGTDSLLGAQPSKV